MAYQVVYTDAAEGSNAQGTLFQGVKFWLSARVPSKNSFIDDIKANGGYVVPLENDADVLIVDHLRKDVPDGSYSYTYISKSIKNGALEDLDDHRAGSQVKTTRMAGSTTRLAKGTRTPYTAEDDKILVDWVTSFALKGGAYLGNTIYQQLEAKNNHHPWQSWRDRFVKFHRDNLESTLQSLPPTPKSQKLIPTPPKPKVQPAIATPPMPRVRKAIPTPPTEGEEEQPVEGKQQAEQSGEQQDSVRFKKKQTEDEEGGIEETGDEDDDGPKPHPPDPEIDKQDWKPFFAKNVKDLMKFGKDILEADSEQRENMWSLYAEDALPFEPASEWRRLWEERVMWLYLNRIDKKSPHIKGVKFSPFSATNAIDMFQYAKKLYEKDKTDKIRAWQKWAKTQAALGVNHSPDEWEEFWRTKILPVFQRDLPKDEDPPTVTSMDGSGDLPVSTKVYGKRKSGKRKRDDIFAVSSSPPPALSPAGKLAKRPKVHRSGEKPIRPASPVRKASPEIPYAPKLPIKPVVPDPSSGGMADEESVAENTPIVIESDDDEEELSISPSPESKREEDDEQAALDAQLLGESSYVQLRSSPKKPTKKVLGTEIPETQFTQVKSQISATPSDHDETVPGSSPPFEAFSPEPPNPTDVDIDETPFSPLPDEISDIVSDEEDNQASQESSTASKVEDAWIENHINAGRNPEDLIVAITAICSEGAFDQELADFVLGFYRNSGRIPQNRRGVWTEADDEKLNSGHVADLENVVAKHGEDAVGKRSGFLRSRDE